MLTRKVQQAVVIDPLTIYPVEVFVFCIDRKRVKLGIQADRNRHPVVREELLGGRPKNLSGQKS